MVTTIDLKKIFSIDNILIHASAESKKRVLELSSEIIATDFPDHGSLTIFQHLLNREKLGSTAIGHGVAIPHCRIPDIEVSKAALLVLKKPIAFDTPDEQGVDIICTLVVPENAHEEHLELLASLAELFSMENMRQQIRAGSEPKDLYQLIINEYDQRH